MLHPALAGTGIVFQKTCDCHPAVSIPARWDSVSDTTLCTVVSAGGVSVGTIEHLMAALRGMEVDNCLIEINGPEVPIMDGSALPFTRLIEQAGIAEQPSPKRAIRITRQISVSEGDRSAHLFPSTEAVYGFQIDFASRVVAQQKKRIALSQSSFRHEIARARTFGFLEEVEWLRSRGLARGGSLENAIVINGDKVLNSEGLRFPDEFVRHKILDAIGDLYLAGAPIIGRFHGVRSGHKLNNLLLVALFADQSAWTWTSSVTTPEGMAVHTHDDLLACA